MVNVVEQDGTFIGELTVYEVWIVHNSKSIIMRSIWLLYNCYALLTNITTICISCHNSYLNCCGERKTNHILIKDNTIVNVYVFVCSW